MYDWRRMTDDERKEILDLRIVRRNSWHRPPVFEQEKWFHISAACYEHRSLMGFSPERMSIFAHDLLEVFTKPTADLFAWVLLPNHYHVLSKIYNLALLRKRLGQLHGRSSHTWNVEESCAGRKCFHSALFKDIKSEAHWESTVNYIHHNPVKHGYVKKWSDWPFGSAIAYLSSTPREAVQSHWKQYPITGMGKGWDE